MEQLYSHIRCISGKDLFISDVKQTFHNTYTCECFHDAQLRSAGSKAPSTTNISRSLWTRGFVDYSTTKPSNWSYDSIVLFIHCHFLTCTRDWSVWHHIPICLYFSGHSPLIFDLWHVTQCCYNVYTPVTWPQTGLGSQTNYAPVNTHWLPHLYNTC